MSALLRHMALRLWLTALAGGLISLALLPGWQRVMGIAWLALPCLLMLTACFMALGWGMNGMGLRLMRRHLKEAAVWERAGMSAEAETAFQKAVALFDSFWLSPAARRKKAPWFQGVLARYYLGPSSAGAYARSVVAGYLIRYPQDDAVAEQWLEQLLIYPSHLQEEHEAATRVGNALVGRLGVQRLLMQFYLAVGSFGFDARQTCRRVWQFSQPLSDELVCKLGRMLLEAAILSPWALQVYLKAHAAGETGVLAGVAAAYRWLPPTEENRGDLAAAKALLADMDRHRLDRLTARFEPVAVAVKSKSKRPVLPAAPSLTGLLNGVKPLMIMVRSAGSRMGALVRRKWAGAKLLPLAGVIALTVVLGIGAWYLLQPEPEAPPVVVEVPEIPVITDPFTIQVAAYMSAGDAQDFVDQLAQKGLAAFRTKAASANRTWYQVKVSHFATKAEAQSYGNELKSKGLIDDFYVANYEPPVTDGS